MIGDVVDEDELATGERREGVYLGCLTFLRKLGGALGIWFATVGLELAGYDGTAAPDAQPADAITAIRAMTGLGPAFFLALALWVASRYGLSRAAHTRIRAQLAAREAG